MMQCVSLVEVVILESIIEYIFLICNNSYSVKHIQLKIQETLHIMLGTSRCDRSRDIFLPRSVTLSYSTTS